MTLLPAVHLWRWNSPLTNALGLLLAVGAGLLLISLPLTTALILAVLAALALATLIEPLLGIAAGLFLGLLRAYLQTEVPQIPAQVGHLFIALAAAAWLGRGWLCRDLRLPRSPLLLPLLGFVGAAWLSLWNPADLLGYGLPELVKWLELVLVFVVVAARLEERHILWLVIPILLIGLFQAGVGLYQFGLRGEGPDHFRIPGHDFYRAYGTFEQPNPYGGFIGMTLALGVGVLIGLLRHPLSPPSDSPRRHREHGEGKGNLIVFLLPCLLALSAALVASWSRGAWIGFAAALLAMAAALPRRARWGLLAVALLAVIALGLYNADLLPASVVARLTDFAAELRLEDVRGVGINSANYAVIERLAHWQSALEMWRTHFWTGVGLGCYEPAYPRFALVNWPFALGHAHNLYLNLLAETGLLGLLAYLVFWGAVFWQTWQVTRRADGLARGIAIGLLGAWTQLSVHHLFDNLYVNNVHLLIAMLLALCKQLQTGVAVIDERLCPTPEH